MHIKACLTMGVLAAMWTGSAAEAKPALPALAPVPKEAIGFLHVPQIDAFERDLKRFGDETGWKFGKSEHPVLEALAIRADIAAGLDPGGPAAVVWLDPKQYRQRYTLYVLPVADWDKLLDAAAAEPLGPDQWALTRAKGPRYVVKQGRFALVTSSFRTLDAVLKAPDRIVDSLPAESLDRIAASGPYLYLKVNEIKRIYSDEIASWFRATSGEVYYQPDVVPYADMFTAYMLGLANFIDQTDVFEGWLRFDADGLAADMRIRFADGESVARFLSAQVPQAPALVPVDETRAASVTGIELDPKSRTAAVLEATQFFLEKAPRPEPLPDPTKERVTEAVRTFMESLGPRITDISAPPPPGNGLVSSVSIYQLANPKQFQDGIQKLAAAWENLADQLHFYLRIETLTGTEDVDGVPVTVYIPRMKFGLPARHEQFRKRMEVLYGADGLCYRMAVVNNYGVVGTGSDQTLFRNTVKALKAGKPGEPPAAFAQIEKRLPARQNVSFIASLPLALRQSLIRGGTDPDRIGTIDPGAERAGVGMVFGGSTVSIGSYWPHEQLRLARELLARVAPKVVEAPESLFEPTKEGPPRSAGTPPLIPPAGPAPEPPPAPSNN